ncbi:hypothetical protein EDF82_0433 [Raoultella sp. BIGb0399]|nr:hypothetical protein EDF82_0433 [Raoultella sp. BIGb0399]
MILWITLSHKLKYHFEIAIQLFIRKLKLIHTLLIKIILRMQINKYKELRKITRDWSFNYLKS